MPRYSFKGGKITVEEGVYEPILKAEREKKDKYPLIVIDVATGKMQKVYSEAELIQSLRQESAEMEGHPIKYEDVAPPTISGCPGRIRVKL